MLSVPLTLKRNIPKTRISFKETLISASFNRIGASSAIGYTARLTKDHDHSPCLVADMSRQKPTPPDSGLSASRTPNDAFEPSDRERYAASQGFDDEIDLRELFFILWKRKWIIIAVTICFAIGSVWYSLSLSNYYRANALLASATDQSGSGLAGLSGQFGGLASLAGISLPAGGTDKVALALEVMQSRQFAFALIEDENLIVPFIAAKSWDKQTKALILDDELYDTSASKWLRPARGDRAAVPTLQEAYERYLEIFTFSQDKKSGLVTIAAEFYSPVMAKKWVDEIILRINATMKAKDMAEAQKSIAYLEQQIAKTPVADMQNVFYQLVEEQSKTMMLAEVRDEYVFTTIDPAVVPERKAGPKRSLICLLGTMVGGILAVFGVLLVSMFRSDGDKPTG